MAYDPTQDYAALLDPVAWPAAEGIAVSAIHDGRPVVAGTRWLVEIVGDYGTDPAERAIMLREYPRLTEATIDGAIAYFSAHRALFARARWQRQATREELLEVARALLAVIRGEGIMGAKVRLTAEQEAEVRAELRRLRDLLDALESDVARVAPTSAIRDDVRSLLSETNRLGVLVKVEVGQDGLR